jgi:hypothetical protein
MPPCDAANSPPSMVAGRELTDDVGHGPSSLGRIVQLWLERIDLWHAGQTSTPAEHAVSGSAGAATRAVFVATGHLTPELHPHRHF